MPTAILIDNVISNAAAYAESLLEQATEMADDAQQIAQGFASATYFPITWSPDPDINTGFVDDTPSDFTDVYVPPDADTIDDPDLMDPVFPTLPTFPAAPAVLDTSGLFDVDKPAWDIPDFTTAAPVINTSVTLPTAPVIELPAAPTGSEALVVPDIVVPHFDDSFGGSLPDEVDVTGVLTTAFEGQSSALIASATAYVESWLTTHCPQYHPAMATLEARIATAMEGGGALNEGWEQAIYDRASVRVADAQHSAQQQITEDYAKRGFTIPPGAVAGAMLRARFEGNRNLADVSAQIAVERAKIELQHLQFTMGLSANIRQSFVSASIGFMQVLMSANGLALDCAKNIARWAAELFTQRVALFDLELKRYQTESEVYKVVLESAFAELRRFQAEIDAEKLKVELDRNQIALFEAGINAEQSKIALYNSQLTAAKVTLEVQAQRITIYEAQVRAYIARVSGKEAEYGAYKAAIQGDAARVEAYQTEVQAYGAGVSAAATRVEAERAVSQAVNEYNRVLLASQEGQIRRYIAEVQAESQRFGASTDAYRTALARYQTEVEARVRTIGLQVDKDRLDLQAAIEDAGNRLKTQALNVEAFLKSIAAQADVTNASARILGDMAASALSVSNAIVSQTSQDDS